MLRVLYNRKSLLVLLLSFSVVGCANVDYVSRGSLKKMGFTEASGKGFAKRYGAIALKSNSSEDDEENSSLILLGKNKSSYVAETILHSRKDDEKGFIDKSYLAVAADRRKKGLMMQVRFVY